jgi:hypothetical protein
MSFFYSYHTSDEISHNFLNRLIVEFQKFFCSVFELNELFIHESFFYPNSRFFSLFDDQGSAEYATQNVIPNSPFLVSRDSIS